MKSTLLVSLYLTVSLLFLGVNFSSTKRDLSGDFASQDIREINHGDHLESVLEILGRPYRLKSLHGLHNLDCRIQNPMLNRHVSESLDIEFVIDSMYKFEDFCCEGNVSDVGRKISTLVYTKPVKFSSGYPMLWVHLDENMRVRSVAAKRYDGYLGLDDPLIYGMTEGGSWEDPVKFKECFR